MSLSLPTQTSTLTQEQADAAYIATGLSHLSENAFYDEDNDLYCYELEDGSSVAIEADGSASRYDSDGISCPMNFTSKSAA